MKILVLNCGSSSVKYQLFAMPRGVILAKGIVERIGEARSRATQTAGDRQTRIERPVKDHRDGLGLVMQMLTDPAKGAVASLGEIAACGHRVVHGGEAATGTLVVDEAVERAIEKYGELAPLHNPPNLAGIRSARAIMGRIPQVACFDTAFHQSLPETAYLYALPRELYEKFHIRRYGFHGTSHQYVARRAAAILGKGEFEVNLITCHLGNGCSATAVQDGKSVDTSMGLTPMEGLVMGTRPGDFDPAIVLHLLKKGYSVDALDRMFNSESGVLGVSGISKDMRDLEAKAMAGNRAADLALDIFAYRLRKYIGAYLAVLNGCDAIVFTGGIGERSPILRGRALRGLDHLGIVLDEARNEAAFGTEGGIHADASRIKLLVIPTNEEQAIAAETYRIVQGQDVWIF
jgi:acetate kinase